MLTLARPMGMASPSRQVQVADERPRFVHPRMVWILYSMEKKNVLLVCQKFHISRKTFYKWLKRYRDSGGNPASLVDISRKPHHFPRAIPPEVVRKIIQARKETGYGQRRLKRHLAQNHNISISEHTIWKLLKNAAAKRLFDPAPTASGDNLRTDPLFGREKNRHSFARAVPEATR